MATTIKIHEDTKKELDLLREYRNESYDEVIKKAVFIARNPSLNKEAIASIEKARERIRMGKFMTEADARKRLSLN
jgi:predicted transcriptional regulator